MLDGRIEGVARLIDLGDLLYLKRMLEGCFPADDHVAGDRWDSGYRAGLNTALNRVQYWAHSVGLLAVDPGRHPGWR